MPWHSVWPLGTVPVRNNEITGTDNTTYIETTMGPTAVGTDGPTVRDHFWNVGPNEDGRHRYIQSIGFTNGPATPADPVLGTAMDGVIYLKQPTPAVGRVEGFYRNTNGIYQFIPSFLEGVTAQISNDYITVVAVPQNVYGEIFMWATAQGTAQESRYRTVSGFFRSDTTVSAWAIAVATQGDVYTNGLKFGNGSDIDGLNIKARTAGTTTNNLTWNYRITYRAI
tara:strand:- start:211 stop:885 length:675 start_codon:yes stop_codon:yes gene_type:complete